MSAKPRRRGQLTAAPLPASISIAPRRVVATGYGVVSALGGSWSAHAAALRDGRCGIGQLSGLEDENLSIRIAAEVKHFCDWEGGDGRIRSSLLDRFSRFALAAAGEAVDSSGISFDAALAPRTATIIGSSQGGAGTLEENTGCFTVEPEAGCPHSRFRDQWPMLPLAL